MRRLLELLTVFLLGGVLTFYLVGSKNKDLPPGKTLPNNPPKSAEQQSPLPAAKKTLPISTPQTVRGQSLLRAKHYLAQGQMDLFMQLMDEHRSDTETPKYRAVFLNALEQLKIGKRYATAVQWLTTYLGSEYDDVAALQMLANIQYLQKNYLAAIDTLYKAKSYAHATAKITQIAGTQRAIINQYATELKSHNNNLSLLDLYQRLVSVEPEYSPNYLGLAEAYLALGNDADARRALNIIAYDPDASSKAQQLLNIIEQRANQTTENSEPIPLRRHGNNLLAQVLFNSSTSSQLLLDTGASLTVISPLLLQELGLDANHPQRNAWFNTANGVVEAPIFSIDRVNVGSQTVDHLEVAVMDLDNQGINGLLGMNFLQHFRFSIDHKHNVLYLSPR